MNKFGGVLRRCLTTAVEEGRHASLRRLLVEPEALVVTREIEWGNVLVGFEQANKYTIRAAPNGEVVGHIAEEDSLGRSLTRNFLRTHRAFKATVFDPTMVPLLRIHRPMYLVSTSLFVEHASDVAQEKFGEVHMHWHPWRRRYDLFGADKVQFARIDGGLLSMDFELKDADGRPLAAVNRDFTGFARELFTDAGQYAIRLSADQSQLDTPAITEKSTAAVETQAPEADSLVERASSLTLAQRAVALGTAVAVDFDYFSRHSRVGGGGFMAPWYIPTLGGGAPVDGADSAPSPNVSGTQTEDSASATSAPSSASPAGAPTPPEPAESNQQWAQFEEHDHGFQAPPEEVPGGLDGEEGAASATSVLGAIFRGIAGVDDE